MKTHYIIWLFPLFIITSCNNAPDCSIDQNNAGKEFYYIDECACFIAHLLKNKGPELVLIEEAILIEDEYMRKIGLGTSELIEADETEPIELNIENLIKYALEEKKIDLNYDQLLDIYTAEEDYLQFIGVIEKKSQIPDSIKANEDTTGIIWQEDIEKP